MMNDELKADCLQFIIHHSATDAPPVFYILAFPFFVEVHLSPLRSCATLQVFGGKIFFVTFVKSFVASVVK